MHRQFEQELEELKSAILTMAGLAESSLRDACRALGERDAELAQAVVDRDDEVDALELEVDRLARDFIVRHQPAATDLRFVIVALKIGPELERIADHAVNIAERAIELSEQRLLEPLVELPRMLSLAGSMVTDAIAAYVNADPVAAREVIERDDEIDRMYWQIFRELLTIMIDDPGTISRAIELILVARFGERIGDQATNICEEVVYLVEGHSIRHEGLIDDGAN